MIVITIVGSAWFFFGVILSLFTSLQITIPLVNVIICLVELFLLVRLPKAGLVGFPIALILGYSLHTVQFFRDLQGYVGPQKDL